MKNNTKYYTPELWEFQQGIEYEIFSHAENRWVTGEFFLESPTNEFFAEKLLAKEIRMKCLDQEDIESLGFAVDIGYGYAKLYQREGCDIMTQNGEYFKIDATNGRYEGVVRNKFHLNQILRDIA